MEKKPTKQNPNEKKRMYFKFWGAQAMLEGYPDWVSVAVAVIGGVVVVAVVLISFKYF